jgi:hypothetical protein
MHVQHSSEWFIRFLFEHKHLVKICMILVMFTLQASVLMLKWFVIFCLVQKIVLISNLILLIYN